MAAARGARTAVIVALVIAVCVGVGFAARAIFTAARTHFTSDSCTVGGFDLDPDQASVAATMVGAVTKYRTRLPERAAVLVLAAGLQESKLTNLAPGQGDRDSVGVLQQRPSQGWGGGKDAPLKNVSEATTEFLRALVKVPNWQTRSLADAVQAVQISADGNAYAQHEGEAQALSDALTGKRSQAVTCSFAAPGKVATPAAVVQLARTELGIDTPTARGTQVVVAGAAWQTVGWFVANANRLGIDQVDYAGRRWTRTDGWHAQKAAASTAVVATMHKK